MRQAVGLTQAQVGAHIGYSRSTVARAEATGVCSRDFCALAGRLYEAGETLVLAHDRIQALGAAARTRAARHRPPSTVLQATQTNVTSLVLDAACPHCGKPLAVMARMSAAMLPTAPAAGPP